MDLFAPRHLLIILLVCLLVFGTKKLRTIGSDLGAAVRGFKNAMSEVDSSASIAPDPPAPPAPEVAKTQSPGILGAPLPPESKNA